MQVVQLDNSLSSTDKSNVYTNMDIWNLYQPDVLAVAKPTASHNNEGKMFE